MWQDKISAIVNLSFAVMLVPMLFDNQTAPISTSLPTAIGLFILAYTWYSLKLYFTAISSTLAGVIWLAIFIQDMV